MLKMQNIFLDVNAKTRNDALKAISKKAVDLNIINKKDTNLLFEALLKRENESTTGFQDGISIPHARIKQIKSPSLIFIRYKNEVEWPSLDSKKIKVSFCLLIPDDKNASIHIDMLSKIATSLIDDDFRAKIVSDKETKTSIFKLIKTSLEDKKETVKEVFSNSLNIVGVSACATGVAHTYMAKEALEKAGKELHYNVKIETQGQKGQEFKLTDDEIKKADAIIIATDIYVELDRFVGKKVLKISTNDAISDPTTYLKESTNSPIFSSGTVKNESSSQTKFKSNSIKTFMGHLLTGVSRMIPFIVFSGIVWAILNSIGVADATIATNNIYKIFVSAASVGFTVFIAIMGGFIAESIAGRAGLAPGFIATFVASNSSFYFWWDIYGAKSGIPQIDSFFTVKDISNVGLSLFAAIMMGFAAGYLVKWINTWKTHKLLTPIMPIIFIPVIGTSILVFPFVILLSGPLGYLMNGLVYGLSEAARINGVNFLMGFILGVMIGFDMGGPINKIAGTAATALITIDPRLMGAVAAAIPVAPLGCGLATIIAFKMFSEKERAEGITAIGLGFFGISEGAIPFAVNRPKKVLIANMIGSGIASGLSFLFYVGGYVGMWGGPITALVLGVKAPVTELGALGTTIPTAFGGGGVPGMEFLAILWFFLAIAAGSIIHALILIIGIKLETNDGKKELEQKWSKFKNKFDIKRYTNKFVKNSIMKSQINISTLVYNYFH
ncbi:MAG: fructose-specific PTS transporter subunit EIIC [Malacoplasma sp.]